MTRRGRRFVGGAIAGAVISAAIVVALRGPAEPSPRELVGARTGLAIGAGLAEVSRRAHQFSAPYDCARLPPTPAGELRPVGSFGDRAIERSDSVVKIGSADQALTVAFVADSHGTTTGLQALRKELERHDVELVVALGGIGGDRAQLVSAYKALAGGAAWPLLVLPGALESIPEHRAALAQLANDPSLRLFDGTQTRLLLMDGTAVATVPGVTTPQQLAAGRNGCAHSQSALTAFAAFLAGRPERLVLASYVPPRQRGATGSDLAAGGIHIGEPALASLVSTVEPVAVVHGLLDEAAGDRVTGTWSPGGAPLYLGTGSAQGLPLYLPDRTVRGASAVVLRITKRRIRWWRVVTSAS